MLNNLLFFIIGMTAGVIIVSVGINIILKDSNNSFRK